MADIRCPMCSRLNPDTTAECRFCGSRLKPLSVPEASTLRPAAADERTLIAPPDSDESAGGEGQSPPWLERLRTQAGTAAPPVPARPESPSRDSPPPPKGSESRTEAPKAPKSGSPAPASPPLRAKTATQPEAGLRRSTGDIFRSLRAAAQSAPPEEEASQADIEPADDAPSWLNALREQAVAPYLKAKTPPSAAADPGGTVQRVASHGIRDRTLRTSGDEEKAAPAPEPAVGHADMPDWLSSLREQAAGSPDLPGREPEERLGAPPKSARSEAAPAAQLPADTAARDWLSSLRGQVAASPAPEPEAPSPPESEAVTPRATPEPLAAPEIGPAADLPDWLRSASEAAAGASGAEAANDPIARDWWPPPVGDETVGAEFATPAPAAGDQHHPGAEIPGWLWPAGDTAVPEQPASHPSGEMPDWLLRLPAAGAAHIDTPLAAPDETSEPERSVPEPDWLASLTPQAPPPLPPTLLTEEDFDFLTAEPEAAAADTRLPAEAPYGGAVGPAPAPEAPAAEDAVEFPADMPEWLRALRPAEAEAESPLLSPESPSPPASAPPAAPAPAIAVTDGGESEPARDDANYPAAIRGLAKATLPGWLEAMRPIALTQPDISAAPEYEETTGPLAGMKGVLAAEPAIALPAAKITATTHPAASETHAAQAKLLEAIVKEETAPRAAPKKAARLTLGLALIERLIVFLFLAVAVVAPFALDNPNSIFPPPRQYPAETKAARDIVATLPTDRPALIAFEYEPGAAGELDPLAEALIRHLAGRGMKVVSISTRPLGAGLAQVTLERVLGGAPLSETPERPDDPARRPFVNLGYLPGGVMSLPVFARAPRQLILDDFGSTQGSGVVQPPEAAAQDIWQTALVRDVHQISDFGMIAVVSNSPETLRAWIEQVKPLAPRTPMIALVSAAAEPLVQPYYLAENPPASPLQGIVSGQFGATSYNQLVGVLTGSPPELAGLTAQRWDAQTLGLLAAAAFIGLGALAFSAFGLIQRRGTQTS